MIKVSVIIPTHNREKMCKRAIASVICQTYDNIEIIVSNDSEKDYDTLDSYIFRHDKVTYFKKNPEGYDKNYIFLASQASGDFLICLEDDDYLLNTNVIQDCVDLINGNKDITAVLMNSATSLKQALTKKTFFKERYTNEEFFELFPSISTEFQFGQVMAKASIIKKIIIEEVPKRYGSVNTDAFVFLMLCLVSGNICYLNKCGYMITVNGDNLSWNNYVNCFFGGNSYIQEIYSRAKHLNVDVDLWKEKMEFTHIKHILKYLPNYLEEVEIVEHS